MIIDEDIETLLYSEKETDNVEDSDNINIPIHFYGFEDQIETSFNIKQTNNQQTENIANIQILICCIYIIGIHDDISWTI